MVCITLAEICKRHGLHPDQSVRALQYARMGGSWYFDSQGRIYWPVRSPPAPLREEPTREPSREPVAILPAGLNRRLDSLQGMAIHTQNKLNEHLDKSRKKDRYS